MRALVFTLALLALFFSGCDTTSSDTKESGSKTADSSLDVGALPADVGTPPPSFPKEIKDI